MEGTPPKCVVDSTTEGSLASLPKSFKPTRFARSRQQEDYQPSKAELEAEVSIDTTPEELAKAFFSSGAARRERVS